MCSSDLEYKIHALLAAHTPIDVFGVGTDLATSSEAPSSGVVYKLVEIQDGGRHLYPSKLSPGKHTLPGAKQIFRHADHDVLGLATECLGTGEALQGPVMLRGELLEPLPTLEQSRDHATQSIAKLPSTEWRVLLSPALQQLDEKVSHEHSLL